MQLHQRLIRTHCDDDDGEDDDDDDDDGDYEDDAYDEDDDADCENDAVDDDDEYADDVDDVVVDDDDGLHPTLSTPDVLIQFVDAFSLQQPRRTPLTRMYSQFW